MITIALAGAGLRGTWYARLAAATGNAKIVAVAEPDAARRERVAHEHDIPPERVFPDWESMAALPKLADAAIVATQDTEHVEPAVRLAELGYHLLLEKPMAPTEAESTRIVEAVERSGVMLAVCHVLRYTAHTRTLKQLLDAGRIGDVVSVQHLEPIGWWHFAHSYVRGNWRREADSSPMLLAKACHDLDWLSYLLGRPALQVASFGGLTHFRRENQPAGATDTCLTCPVEPTCPYSAQRLYLGCLGDPAREVWPLRAVTEKATEQDVMAALAEGPYGRCVYACDNDAADQQVVALAYEGGVTATVSVMAFTFLDHRKTRVFDTRGTIESDGVTLTLQDFVTGQVERIQVGDVGASAADGHGGGDEGLIAAFVAAVADDDPSLISSGPQDSLISHRTVWAAERARRTGTVVTLPRPDDQQRERGRRHQGR